jgi:hypothetical protein
VYIYAARCCDSCFCRLLDFNVGEAGSTPPRQPAGKCMHLNNAACAARHRADGVVPAGTCASIAVCLSAPARDRQCLLMSASLPVKPGSLGAITWPITVRYVVMLSTPSRPQRGQEAFGGPSNSLHDARPPAPHTLTRWCACMPAAAVARRRRYSLARLVWAPRAWQQRRLARYCHHQSSVTPVCCHNRSWRSHTGEPDVGCFSCCLIMPDMFLHS